MNILSGQRQKQPKSTGLYLAAILCIVLLLGILIPRIKKTAPEGGEVKNQTVARATAREGSTREVPGLNHFSSHKQSAEEVVAAKLTAFARDRRAITRAMARRFGVPMSAEVERFYDLAETGRWEDLKASYESLIKSKHSDEKMAENLNEIWGPIHETFGVAEVAHDWPAKKLLDYGEAVLGSLRPGMVYAGGTDAGRFIPTLLNATSGGEPFVVITQNALADNSYLKYVSFLYENRIATPAEPDSQKAFQEYLADAQKRLAHDQQFPDAPRELRPGEDVRIIENRVQVSGQVAVMTINEKLFQQIMEKNPSLSFALEESFPFKTTYANAAPLGPLMELNVPPEHPFSADAAAQTIEYWNGTVEDLLADPETITASEPRKAWSKMVVAQAHLLTDHNYRTEAEQAYQLASRLSPDSPEVVFGYVNLLLQQSRPTEAAAVAESARTAAPNNEQFRALAQQLKGISASQPR